MKVFLFFLLILNNLICFSQNLVPNPSFEEKNSCPGSAGGLGPLGQEPWLLDWYSMSWTPDYMHMCAGDGASNYPLQNAWGYQAPFHGEAYVSILTYTMFVDEREYIAIELESELEINQNYQVSFRVSDADGGEQEYIDCVSNNLGVRFLKNPNNYWINELDNNPLIPDNFAHINEGNIVVDSLGWTEVSGIFTADDTYTHLVIGNFFDDANTNIIQSGTFDFCFAMYYIDAVCVVLEEDTCSEFSSVSDIPYKPELGIRIEQNQLYILGDEFIEFRIYDIAGELILNSNYSSDPIHIESFDTGIYIIQIMIENGDFRVFKFLKNE